MKFTLSLVLFLTFFQVKSQEAQAPQTIDLPMAEMIQALNIPGMSVAISKNGKMVYQGSFGYSDLKKKKKTDAQTMFRMASTSKLFAAGAIAILIDKGLVHIDDPVEKYLENYKHKGRGVTIRRILNHTSGIRHYGKGDRFIDMKNYKTTDDALEIFIDDQLESEPGSKYKYSTHSFTILAAIVEKVSDQTYTDFLHQEIFTPLGMTRSRPDVKGARDDNQTNLYKGSKKALVDNASYKRAGGGMLSTATDLVKFGESQLMDGLISQATRDLLFTPSVEMPGTIIPTEIGMAWRISEDARGEQIFHHAGSMNGARSFLMLSPSDSMVVAIMTNNRKLDFIEHLACGLRDMISGEINNEQESNFVYADNTTVTASALFSQASITGFTGITDGARVSAIANRSSTGLVYRNLVVEKEVLYFEAGAGQLRTYIQDTDGQWVEKVVVK